MKTKLFFVALVMTFVCLSALYAKEEPENLLLDPGFEEIKKPEDLIAGTGGPWQVRGAEAAKGELAKPTIDKKDFIEGEQSIYVKDIKAGWTDMQQGWFTGTRHFVLDADQEYTLAAWMKTSVPGNVTLKVISWTDPFPTWGSKRVTVETDWAEYFLTCTPKDLTERPWLEFRFGSVKDIWFDFAHFYEGKYVPSEGPHAVTSQDKLAATWGEIRRAR